MNAAPTNWQSAVPFLEPLTNSLECGVMLIDHDERIVFASEALGAMFGVTVKEIVAMTPGEFVRFAAGMVKDPPALLRENRVLPQNANVVCEEFELAGAVRSVVRWVARRLLCPWPGTIVVCTDITAEVDLTAAFERLAVTDGLTSLPNRRGAEQAIAREISRTRRYGSPLSFAVVDIDHFKKVNDTQGHGAGDQILRQVAKVIGAQVRPTDTAARWGGEEFLLVLPNTDLAGARACAERIRATIETISRVTISVGVAEMTANEKPSDTISRADVKLYEAKGGGRNRVCG